MRCRNCGHLITKIDNKLHHKQINHSMYCPCGKPEMQTAHVSLVQTVSLMKVMNLEYVDVADRDWNKNHRSTENALNKLLWSTIVNMPIQLTVLWCLWSWHSAFQRDLPVQHQDLGNTLFSLWLIWTGLRDILRISFAYYLKSLKAPSEQTPILITRWERQQVSMGWQGPRTKQIIPSVKIEGRFKFLHLCHILGPQQTLWFFLEET